MSQSVESEAANPPTDPPPQEDDDRGEDAVMEETAEEPTEEVTAVDTGVETVDAHDVQDTDTAAATAPATAAEELAAAEDPKAVPVKEKLVAEDAAAAKQEQHYSTRGRHKEADPETLEKLDRHFEEEERERKDHHHPSSSFLDVLSEDERRTRTRFLPDVGGIHALFKTEIKQDVQMARTIVSSTGVSSALSSRRSKASSANSKRARDDDDEVMGDDEELPGVSEDERMSETGATSTSFRAMENGADVPSYTFLPPQDIQHGETGDIDALSRPSHAVKSPFIVDSITAFNPPRPPESVGAKKKHRLMRWERRPEDVEVDLNTYKKTVQRTRSELSSAMKERERIEIMAAHLQNHFMAQLSGLNEEGTLLMEELGAIQLDCVKAADLLQSRTRSRGVGKGSYVMKDVLNILKQKGTEIMNFPAADDSYFEGEVTSGIGGMSTQSFIDWNGEIAIKPSELATGWLLPGSTVTTPYGEGTVVQLFGPSMLDVNATPVADQLLKPPPPPTPQEEKPQHGFGAADSASKKPPGDKDSVMNGSGNPAEPKPVETVSTPEKKDKPKKKKSDPEAKEPAADLSGAMLYPRVCVKLPFGVGYFPLDSLSSSVKVSSYSDTMLAARWQKMTDSALSVSGCLDYASIVDRDDTSDAKKKVLDASAMVVDGEGADEEAGANNGIGVSRKSDRVIPFGSNLLPTVAGRGSLPADAPLAAAESMVNDSTLQADGFINHRENKGVPKLFREWEDVRDELTVLRGEVLQRRNELARQRRVRAMNEKTLSTSRDKSLRVDGLVTEMRADLKSLKDRLDYELNELGIDGEMSEKLLSAHYSLADNAANNSADAQPPPKRQRRLPKEKEAPPLFSPKQTRRRTADANVEGGDADDKNRVGVSTEEDDDARPTKRSRPNQ